MNAQRTWTFYPFSAFVDGGESPTSLTMWAPKAKYRSARTSDSRCDQGEIAKLEAVLRPQFEGQPVSRIVAVASLLISPDPTEAQAL
jgi:hypothetical protein